MYHCYLPTLNPKYKTKKKKQKKNNNNPQKANQKWPRK